MFSDAVISFRNRRRRVTNSNIEALNKIRASVFYLSAVNFLKVL